MKIERGYINFFNFLSYAFINIIIMS